MRTGFDAARFGMRLMDEGQLTCIVHDNSIQEQLSRRALQLESLLTLASDGAGSDGGTLATMNGELLSGVFWLATELATEITMLVDHQNRKGHDQTAPLPADAMEGEFAH